MRLLLDTHALLWYVQDDKRLPDLARKAINYFGCYYSMATLWEIAIKKSIDKLELNVSMGKFANDCETLGIRRLYAMPRHLDVLVQLPHIHRDPFDRLLVAQAISDGLTLVTKDRMIPKYDVPTLWE